MRKSKREKEKEREEAKKREEEELAAKTYAEFLDAFEGEGARKKGGGFVRAGGEPAEYNPRGRGRQHEGMRAFEDDNSHVRLFAYCDLHGETDTVNSTARYLLPNHCLQGRKVNAQWTTSWRKSKGNC